jgi:hypothetical protein
MTWSRMLVVGAVTTVLATGAAAAAGQESILLTVGPSISFEPSNIRITSRVEPSATNRALIIVVESGSHYSSSEIPLEGERAARSRSMLLKTLPAGDYEVVATLRTETGTGRVLREKFQVVSGHGDAR